MKPGKTLITALTFAAALGVSAVSFTANAALAVGAKAPDFALKGALAGKPIDFSLQKALQKGPVVLYFFPAAFSAGCTIEAHDFAEATDDFSKIGVTAGNTDQVSDFSKLECRDKFAVAADPGAKVAAQYDTLMQMKGKTLSDRTSYVIAPNGDILLSYTDRNPETHITKTLAAVKQYDAAHPQTH